jgi:hypothetical protein
VKLAVEHLEDRLTPSGGVGNLPSMGPSAGTLATGVNAIVGGTVPGSKTNGLTTQGPNGGGVSAASTTSTTSHEIEVGGRHHQSSHSFEMISVQQMPFFGSTILFGHHFGFGQRHFGGQAPSRHQHQSQSSNSAPTSPLEMESPGDQLFGNFSAPTQWNTISRQGTSQAQSPNTPNTPTVRKTLADSILAFGKERLGEGVDDPGVDSAPGTRTSAGFVSSALRAAGAQDVTAGKDPMNSQPAREHQWGGLVLSHSTKAPGVANPDPDWSKVRPGDVIQFWNVALPNTSRTPFSKHTAIVEQNLGQGRFRVLHQDLDDLTRTGPDGRPLKRPYVTQDALDLSGMTRGPDSTKGPGTSDGKVTVFRPRPAEVSPAQDLPSVGQ